MLPCSVLRMVLTEAIVCNQLFIVYFVLQDTWDEAHEIVDTIR